MSSALRQRGADELRGDHYARGGRNIARHGAWTVEESAIQIPVVTVFAGLGTGV